MTLATFPPQDVVPEGGNRGAVLWWLPDTKDTETGVRARAFEELKVLYDAAGVKIFGISPEPLEELLPHSHPARRPPQFRRRRPLQLRLA